MAEYKPFLDELFDGDLDLMWVISEEQGYFTNYAFIRKAIQRHQRAYIGLLNAVAEHRDAGEDDKWLFNIAHENIGSRLSRIAQDAGYEQDKQSDIRETNIFGDDTACVVYHRTARVRQPETHVR